MFHRRALLIPLLAIVLSLPAPAQSQTALAQPPGESLRVFLITMGPGADPWEKFGHDCIRILDPIEGTDRAYNWGVFSFGEGVSGFVSFAVQFLRGRLMYSMQSDPTLPMLDLYAQAGRSLLIQELELTADQKLGLQRRLVEQDTEANRYYLYDYFQKNCATMARDALDKTVDGRIAAVLKDIRTGTTYRWHDRRLTADEPWLYTFLDYALGHPIDHELSAWEESFLPMQLAVDLRNVRVPDATGQLVPLVKWEKQLTTGVYTERKAPPGHFVWGFLATGLTTGATLFALARSGRRFFIARLAFTLLGVIVSLLLGLLGAIITYAWFSDHLAAMWNENWFHANPLSLLLIVAIPLARRWPRTAWRIAVVVLALGALGTVIKILPWFRQPNWQIISLTLPTHGGMALGLCALSGRVRAINPNAEIRIPE